LAIKYSISGFAGSSTASKIAEQTLLLSTVTSQVVFVPHELQSADQPLNV